MGHPQQPRDGGVPPGLLGHAVAGVRHQDDQRGRRRAGHHVPRVLHVARRVGQDEAAARRGEVAVGDVDGDALFPFGPQAVGQQGQVAG